MKIVDQVEQDLGVQSMKKTISQVSIFNQEQRKRDHDNDQEIRSAKLQMLNQRSSQSSTVCASVMPVTTATAVDLLAQSNMVKQPQTTIS